MRRETAQPTPLHAADLQFQAFAEFDGAKALSEIRCPTLVLTGDLDQLIRPQNSKMLAHLIPGAKLVVIPGGGHRVLWEAVDECTALIADFLSSLRNQSASTPQYTRSGERLVAIPHLFASSIELLAAIPLAFAKAGFESFTVGRQSILLGTSRFGDGKPIVILAPQFPGSDLMLLPLSIWLKALGYRPVSPETCISDTSDVSLTRAIDDITRRVGRKAILVTHAVGMARALRIAANNKGRISDVVVLEATRRSDTSGVRTHFVSPGFPLLFGLAELPRLLRSIAIELIDKPKPNGLASPAHLVVEGAS